MFGYKLMIFCVILAIAVEGIQAQQKQGKGYS